MTTLRIALKAQNQNRKTWAVNDQLVVMFKPWIYEYWMSLSIANVFQKPKFQVSLRKASSKHLIIVAIVFIKLETHQVYYEYSSHN